MTDPLTLPVLPLRDTVVFPGVTVPIQAGRRSTLEAIQKATKGEEKLVFAVAQRDNVEEIAADRLYTIGTVARIGQIQRGRGFVQLMLRGERRGIALRIVETDGHLEALVRSAEEMLPVDPREAAFEGLQRELRQRAAELGQKAGFPEEVVTQVLSEANEPALLADLVASYLEIELSDRQALLETLAVDERLRRVLVHVQRQIGILDAQADIKSEVQRELGDRQREMVLREQLRAIQKELGDGADGEEVDELREKIEKLDLPEEARKEVDRELSRLGRMNRESMEYQVIRNYLETVAELPWNERSDDHLDLAEAARILAEDHYALTDVKDRVLEFLAVRQLRQASEERATAEKSDAPDAGSESGPAAAAGDGETAPVPGNEDDRTAKGPILLFAGPPGVGKTSIAKSIARAMGRKYARISLGGARDEADIRGHRRTYVGAMPGRIIQALKQVGSKNPVFLLDEVDKLGVSYQGDPASALLEVLDPAQNDSFTDHYLGIPFDLSEVLFIATANFLESIPEPLRDRMEMVEFTGYTEKEKLEIARRYLVPRQTRANALTEEQLEIGDEAISETITGYTREAGVRQLEREIGKLARKVARRIAAGDGDRYALGPADVGELLGRPRIHPEKAAGEPQVGVATGMFYTPVGGDILFVEASTMRGKGRLVLTGQLGEVMKESGQAAWSYARSRAGELGIDEAEFERDVHIHVPAGAVPKDGPSAGVTIATALVSALSDRPVRNELAMTGEITLTGRVLPIGGVKEKVLGAVRAGIRTIVLPRQNEADLEDLPGEVRETLEIHPVEDLSEVLELALTGSPREPRVEPVRPGAGDGSALSH
ncbi:MAG: endopeptidase La [Thermoanaerobaculia bacterium]|nr:endopeptidase La [Thermoanaerobaculia bacterium]